VPLRPKHSLGEPRPRAARQFTDREDFVAAFQSELARKDSAQHRLLVFYGIGGIGKTSLRRELGKLLEPMSDRVYAVLDFDVPSYRDMEIALYVLRKSLAGDFKVRFPAFDIAYAAYWQKTRPQTPMTRANLPLLDESSLLADIISVAGAVPFVGILPKLAFFTARAGKYVADWWTRRGQRELWELPGLEPAQIAERLPMFFAADLKDHLVQNGAGAVLFLDSYEALSEAERTEAQVYHRDEWVRELVTQLPGVLWVVCGREKLRWEELDSDWTGCLSQHLVGGLSEADVDKFLVSCGIEEGAIRKAIAAGSGGVPYFLDLAVDTCEEIGQRKNRAPVPDDFARTPRDVLDRFLRHLTREEVETLKVLSVPRFWDFELLQLLVKEYQTGFPLTAFDDLCRFSFLNPGMTPGAYTMHQLMRQSLAEHLPQELKQRIHRFLFDHYSSRLSHIDIKHITEQHRLALSEAFYHGKNALGAEAFFDWFKLAEEPFNRAAQWRFLTPLYEETAAALKGTLGSEHPSLALSLNNLALLLRAQGKYAEAEPLYRRALAIREKALDPEHPDVAASLSNLAMLLHSQGRYAEAEPLHRRALAIRERLLGPEHPDVAESLNNLAWLLHYKGKYAEAEPLYRRALVTVEKALGPEHPRVAKVLDEYAKLCEQTGRADEAAKMRARAETIRAKQQ
jgi:tetratricopeptide (TPR) repeat protein